MYTTKHAQKLFDLKSDQTIRNWIKEFAEFLSIDATPGKGIELQLNAEDMAVLELVARMRSERRSADEIYATLKTGQTGDLPPYTPEEMDVLVKGDYEKQLALQLGESDLKVQELTAKLEQLNATIQPIRDRNIQMESEISSLKERLELEIKRSEQERNRSEKNIEQAHLRERAQQETFAEKIAELRSQIARLEVRLEIEQEKNNDEKK